MCVVVVDGDTVSRRGGKMLPTGVIPSMGSGGVAMRNTVYNLFMRRTSTYIAAILVGGMIAENTVDVVADTMWTVNNKGVRYPTPGHCPCRRNREMYTRCLQPPRALTVFSPGAPCRLLLPSPDGRNFSLISTSRPSMQ